MRLLGVAPVVSSRVYFTVMLPPLIATGDELGRLFGWPGWIVWLMTIPNVPAGVDLFVPAEKLIEKLTGESLVWCQ